MLPCMKTFMAALHHFKASGVLTDVNLKLSDESNVQCHRLVLMAASPYFKAMFESDFEESTKKEIQLKFPNPDTMRQLVAYFYSGEIAVDADNVQEIAIASDFLCLKDLKNECDDLMATLVDTSNCIALRHFAKKYKFDKLMCTTGDIILENFKEVVRSCADFGSLTEEELVEVVSDDKLNAEFEDIVFDAVVR